MNTATILANLELIASRSPAASVWATDAAHAARNNSPMVRQRYERVVAAALADETAQWTDDERRALLAVYANDELKLRAVRLTDADWARANQIGGNNASRGIRAALREYEDQKGGVSDEPNH